MNLKKYMEQEMMTPSQKLAFVRSLYARYRKEAIELGQRSPYRQKLFIKARIAGKKPEKALEASRRKHKGTDKKAY